jgi:ABC-type Fe3+-hydroxamate transport system substrate-binding protein
VRRIALLSLAVFALVALAGCGTESDQSQVVTLTPAQVSQTFKQATGRPLEPEAVSDPAWDQLGYGLDMSQNLVNRYGIFNVYVGKPGKTASLASLFKDKETGKPLARGADSVYWELDSQSKTWVAYKRYSGNVVLVWFSGSKEQQADERFERLDSILSGLPG